MRVAFCGKGGSGKTTLSALFTKYMIQQGAPVITIDADINQRLGDKLGFLEEELNALPKMGNEIERIQVYVRGENPRIATARSVIKTTPPGSGSKMIRYDGDDPISRWFQLPFPGGRFMAVGGFDEESVGSGCYHTFTAALSIYLNHLVDREGEYIIADMTAGGDPFVTGLLTRFDLVYLVVEPTQASVDVFRQCQEYTEPFGTKVRVIANKIEDDDDLDYIRRGVGDAYLGALSLGPVIFTSAAGRVLDAEVLLRENEEVLKLMKAKLDHSPRDWDHFARVNREFHRRAAESWASALHGYDLLSQIDDSFVHEAM
jgi:CO dehydrogenase maturation factor